MRAHALVVTAFLAGCGVDVSDSRPDPVVHQATQELRPTDTNAGLMWHFANGETVDSFKTFRASSLFPAWKRLSARVRVANR